MPQSLGAQESGPAPAGVSPLGVPPPGTRYYLSNELGMPLEEIGWYRAEEAAFVLTVRTLDGLEVRTLLKEGVEIERWEREGREERTYRDRELVERVLLDEQGRRLELSEYEAGTLVRHTEFSYSPGGEIRARAYDGEGNLLYTDRALLSPDKGLREVRRETPEGEGARFALSMSNDRLVEERASGDGRTVIKRYDLQGRLFQLERWSGDRLAERETLRYRDDGETLASSTLVDHSSGDITVRSYDQRGDLERVEVRREGQAVEETRYQRDAEGRPTLATRRGPLGIEQWRYEYDAEGELRREEYRLRGALRRVTRYEDEGRSTEELYRDGELFMRVAFEEGQKLREEFLQDGAVVRTRSFPKEPR